MAKSFDELVAKTTSKAVRDKAELLTRDYLAGILLSELRKLKGISQRELAEILHIKQPSLSKLENQKDMQISTLQNIIKALGGHLVIKVILPEQNREAELKQFRPAGRPRRVSTKTPGANRLREFDLV